jgi:ribosomal protein S28E/S33
VTGRAADDRQAGTVIQVLSRWEASGGVWRVLSRSAARVQVVLLTCDAGEEMDRFTSTDAEVLEFIGLRTGSEDPAV